MARGVTGLGESTAAVLQALEMLGWSSGDWLHVGGEADPCGVREEAARAMKVSFDLAAAELVRERRGKLLDLLESCVDLVFANAREALELTGQEPEEACDTLAELCETAVVMMGCDGVWIRSQNEKVHVPACLVKSPLDMSGSGDLFIAGFLHGVLCGRSLLEAGRIGAAAAGEVVQMKGNAIPRELWSSIVAAAEAPSASVS